METQNKKLTICSVGDLMICDSPLYASVGVGSKYASIRGRLFQNCRDLFRNADITIGNFETVVHEPRNKSLKETQMCCHESVVADLKDAGFTILNIANNHCMQHGISGFENTKRACEKNGIKPIGIKDEEPYVIEKNGFKVAFLSLCIHLEWYEPDHILYEDRIDKILNTVKILRQSDEELVIVTNIHWGDEFAAYPSNAQIALAHKLVDLGTNIILGHHSHVYQGIEIYKDSLIAYGQGNYISDMVPDMCRQTGVLKILIEGNNRLKYEVSPYYIQDNYIPVLAAEEWLKDRYIILQRVKEGSITDDCYWKEVSKNHRIAHKDFIDFFKHNFFKYNIRISVKMIRDYIVRKAKRTMGTSSDGRVSSMDGSIISTIEQFNQGAVRKSPGET